MGEHQRKTYGTIKCYRLRCGGVQGESKDSGIQYWAEYLWHDRVVARRKARGAHLVGQKSISSPSGTLVSSADGCYAACSQSLGSINPLVEPGATRFRPMSARKCLCHTAWNLSHSRCIPPVYRPYVLGQIKPPILNRPVSPQRVVLLNLAWNGAGCRACLPPWPAPGEIALLNLARATDPLVQITRPLVHHDTSALE